MSVKQNFKQISKDNIVFTLGIILILVIAFFTLFKNQKKDISIEELQKALAENQIEYETISSQELLTALNSPLKDDYFLLDIRNQQSFLQKHIVDSINIPAEHIAKSNFSTNLKESQTLIIISDTQQNNQLQSILRYLKNNNYAEYFVLEGGLLAWEKNQGQVVALGNPNSFVDRAKVQYITINQLKEKINSKQTLFIIDIRKADDFKKNHIDRAANIPLAELEAKREKIPRYVPIIVYADTQVPAFQAAALLFDLQISNVYVLEEGFSNWQ